jgi:hydroxymethylglutaryl-CoA lyase
VELVAGLMKGIGVQHVGVADTIGVGTPRKVQRAMEATLRITTWTMCGHFHDTYGQALANTLAALEMGVWQFDTSVAGLGGCPMPRAPPATWPPKTWCTCCTAWASPPASTWTA